MSHDTSTESSFSHVSCPSLNLLPIYHHWGSLNHVDFLLDVRAHPCGRISVVVWNFSFVHESLSNRQKFSHTTSDFPKHSDARTSLYYPRLDRILNNTKTLWQLKRNSRMKMCARRSWTRWHWDTQLFLTVFQSMWHAWFREAATA